MSRPRLVLRPQVALLTGVFFAMALTGYAITFWLPSLVDDIGGLSSFQIGLLTAIPWICAVIAMYMMSRYTDRMPDRRPHLALVLVLSASGRGGAEAAAPSPPGPSPGDPAPARNRVFRAGTGPSSVSDGRPWPSACAHRQDSVSEALRPAWARLA
nr:hypothetical protein [Streptomyces antimycoticus]